MAAFKVERRSIAVAVFVGRHLDYTQVRQLSSVAAKGEASAAGFVTWILSTFRLHSAALEKVAIGGTSRRAGVNEAVLETLRAAGVPVWEVPKDDLLAAYGAPALKTREDLRRCASGIWPILTNTQTCAGLLDAAALGLLVQTERLFID